MRARRSHSPPSARVNIRFPSGNSLPRGSAALVPGCGSDPRSSGASTPGCSCAASTQMPGYDPRSFRACRGTVYCHAAELSGVRSPRPSFQDAHPAPSLRAMPCRWLYRSSLMPSGSKGRGTVACAHLQSLLEADVVGLSRPCSSGEDCCNCARTAAGQHHAMLETASCVCAAEHEKVCRRVVRPRRALLVSWRGCHPQRHEGPVATPARCYLPAHPVG